MYAYITAANQSMFYPFFQKGSGTTPLMLACICGQSEAVDMLVEAKADINQLSAVSATLLK